MDYGLMNEKGWRLGIRGGISLASVRGFTTLFSNENTSVLNLPSLAAIVSFFQPNRTSR